MCMSKLNLVSVSRVHNFDFPIVGFIQKLTASIQQFMNISSSSQPWEKTYLTYEIICPISLLVQVIYLFAKPHFNSHSWLLGIGFAALFLLMGYNSWNDLYAYTRTLLPLTFAFNLLLEKFEKRRSFITWFILGNFGMTWMIFNLTWMSISPLQ